MGDPRKIRKNYQTPNHPWVGSRIEEERQLRMDYGLGNKKEIWRMGSTLSAFKDRAKDLLAQTGTQAEIEQKQLLDRMAKLGLIKSGAGFDDILGLDVKAVLDRRLQTVLIKRHLARTPKQARQMITHRHVVVGGKVITSPGYLVSTREESDITFAMRSPFINQDHAERFSEEELRLKNEREEGKKTKTESKDEEVLAFSEKDIEQAEVLAGEKKVESVAEATAEEKAEKAEATEKAAEPEKPAEKITVEAPVEKPGEQTESSQEKEVKKDE